MCQCQPATSEVVRPSIRCSVQECGEAEAQRHKWIESEKAGRDLGNWAILCWIRYHWNGFLRERWLEHLQGRTYWYELDREFGAKEEVLRGHIPGCRRHLVKADVCSAFETPLLGAGFDPTRPTLWVAEGLLYYLLLADVIAVLRRAAAVSAPGSTLLADLMPASVADLAPELMKRRGDLPPPFGHNDPAALFQAGGWRSVEATPLGAPGANFGRVGPPTGGPAVHLVAAGDPSTGDGVG